MLCSFSALSGQTLHVSYYEGNVDAETNRIIKVANEKLTCVICTMSR